MATPPEEVERDNRITIHVRRIAQPAQGTPNPLFSLVPSEPLTPLPSDTPKGLSAGFQTAPIAQHLTDSYLRPSAFPRCSSPTNGLSRGDAISLRSARGYESNVLCGGGNGRRCKPRWACFYGGALRQVLAYARRHKRGGPGTFSRSKMVQDVKDILCA
jgi:hypothetical protein